MTSRNVPKVAHSYSLLKDNLSSSSVACSSANLGLLVDEGDKLSLPCSCQCPKGVLYRVGVQLEWTHMKNSRDCCNLDKEYVEQGINLNASNVC